MNRIRSLWLTTTALSLLLLAGCTSGSGGAAVVEDDPLLTAAVPTATGTSTPEPSATPIPSPTPGTQPIATAQSGDLTASLDWLYVDSLRAVMGVSLQFPQELSQEQINDLVVMSHFEDASGNMINASTGGGGMMSVGQGKLSTLSGMEFIDPLPSDAPMELNLRLSVTSMSGSGSDYTLNMPVTVSAVAPKEIEVNQSQTVNGIAMTLKTIQFTPSLINALICFDVPPDATDWMPDAEILVDDSDDQWWASSMTPTTPVELDQRCLHARYIAPYDDAHQLILALNPQKLTVNIQRLTSNPPEFLSDELLARAKERLAAEGIEVQFNIQDHGWGYDVVKAPSDMDELNIGLRVHDALSDIFDGPWTFEIPLQ